MYDEESENYVYDTHLFEIQQIVEYCIIPTLTQTLKFVSELITFNLIFLFLVRTFGIGREIHYHIFSTLIGLTYIYAWSFVYNKEIILVIPLVYASYIFMIILRNANTGFCLGATFISILIANEFFYYDHEAWLRVRSVVMIVMMKCMSIAFDLDRGSKLPTVWGFSGYIWCPANSVLGPWITYKDYLVPFQKPCKINASWLLSLMRYVILAIIFVCFSNCVYIYLIGDEHNELIMAHREASCFRMSHYFISYLASGAMVASGFKNEENYSYTITKPLEIEMPRSLVNVVVNWNIPSHRFLKKYVFPIFLPYGQFVAVLMTYLVSSMLHGLNVEVSVVLLSLGVFSYLQYKFQDVMSTILDACVRVRKCKGCKHTRNSTSLITICFNILFSFMTIIYLGYTGCLMENVDTSSTTMFILHTIYEKWAVVHFIGHYTAVISLVIIIFARIVMY